MKLATLICKNALTEVATAIAAIPATGDADIAATVARVATIAVANPTSETSAFRKWRIRHLNGAAMTVLFTPSVTRADVAVVYPGASCEPVPETTARAATGAEDNELRRLIGVVLADAGEVDRDEALAISLTVPHAALTSFRALGGEHMRNGLP